MDCRSRKSLINSHKKLNGMPTFRILLGFILSLIAHRYECDTRRIHSSHFQYLYRFSFNPEAIFTYCRSHYLSSSYDSVYFYRYSIRRYEIFFSFSLSLSSLSALPMLDLFISFLLRRKNHACWHHFMRAIDQTQSNRNQLI